MKELSGILTLLVNEAGAKLTGSYARGEQKEISDLDIYIPEKKWGVAKKILLNSGHKIDSTAIGQLCSSDFTPFLEVSWRFKRQKTKLKKVSLFNIDWKTW